MDIFSYVIEISERLERSDAYFGHGTDNSIDEAAYIVCGLLNIPYDRDLRTQRYNLTPEEIDLLDRKIKHRIKEKLPTAYLVGQAVFAGLEFIADQRALIPRSPIAELVLNRFDTLMAKEPRRVLDLCAGNGCIGISIAVTFKKCLVDLLDNDQECLRLAKENIAKHDLFDRISLVHSDLFEKVNGTYDLIVSNPPYVSPRDYDTLPKEYFHEPKAGLVCEEGGVLIPTKILQNARKYLTDKGILILEVGHSKLNLEKRFPLVPFLWLDFEKGGSGVLAITMEELTKYCKELN